MLRIIGRTIEHVIGRSSEQLEGVEAEAKMVVTSVGEEKSSKEDDRQQVYMLDIIDASGFLHKGSALSSTFPLVFHVPHMSLSDRSPHSRPSAATILP